jgi:DNA-binding CsgD family transcriptional regulator
MTAPGRQIVGRDDELAAITRLLDSAKQLPGTVVLSGEAGIGKTSLWLAGIDAATAQGFRVLSARPSESETGLAFSGVSDLLAEAAGDALPHLPPIQRRVLEATLLLGEPVLVDDRAVAAAFLAAVRRLAAECPLVLAVDDIQWLDAASLGAVRYSLARLAVEPVATLLAIRGALPDWLRRAVPEHRLQTVEVGGLSIGALHELLRARLDATYPRPTLLRIWETSGGNPFFALELAAALQRRGGTLAPGEELPIPTDVYELLQARLHGLGDAALDVARAVAALADPTVELIEAALGGSLHRGLAEALDARILELEGERVRFTHPLLGSAVSARQTPSHRRSLHARLAAVAPSSEERARHLALATANPDGNVAAILEQAAASALARGAPAAAAELAEEALRLTPAPNPGDTRRRLFIAADMHHHAGDAARAIALLDKARAAAAPGSERASVLTHLARVQPGPQRAVALYREALSEAGSDDALQASIHLGLAALMRFTEGIEHGVVHGELAARAASRVDDPALRCRAFAAYGLMHFNAGRGIPAAEMDEALALERSLPEWPLEDGPTWVYAWQLCWSADLDGARELLPEVLRVVQARNDPAGEANALWYLSMAEVRAGNWDDAERFATASLKLWTQLDRVIPPHQFPGAIVAAHRGRIEDARATSQRAVAQAEAEGIGIGKSGHSWVLGFVELSTGDVNAALPHLRCAYELRNGFMLEPVQRLELGDLLEALIAAGEFDEAGEVLATWDGRAASLDRPWALAILARARGLLLAARGDLEGAFASFERALAQHTRRNDPFQHARTLLALGRTQRRAKRRGAARATLHDALAAFERLGAPLWAEQTRAELARIGGRASSRGELTEAEARVAELVARGRTNREVADALFLTVHSVETSLTRIYRKLGVRSRAELASHYPAKT